MVGLEDSTHPTFGPSYSLSLIFSETAPAKY
jgi:hypothetical protein